MALDPLFGLEELPDGMTEDDLPTVDADEILDGMSEGDFEPSENDRTTPANSRPCDECGSDDTNPGVIDLDSGGRYCSEKCAKA